uniref:Triacylglycerol lipase n=1 Tax=Gorilla gorilla gorilla TaxID=9595 RepID=G3QFJ5_GORGO
MLIFWTITLFLLGAEKRFCYEDLGCFSDTEPWGGTAIRPLKILPWSPEKIGTRFLLYTNENPNNFQILLLSDPSTIEASNFQTDRKTRFIIHGFIDKGDESWVTDMCKQPGASPRARKDPFTVKSARSFRHWPLEIAPKTFPFQNRTLFMMQLFFPY